jgi:hypothetical protein
VDAIEPVLIGHNEEKTMSKTRALGRVPEGASAMLKGCGSSTRKWSRANAANSSKEI